MNFIIDFFTSTNFYYLLTIFSLGYFVGVAHLYAATDFSLGNALGRLAFYLYVPVFSIVLMSLAAINTLIH